MAIKRIQQPAQNIARAENKGIIENVKLHHTNVNFILRSRD